MSTADTHELKTISKFDRIFFGNTEKLYQEELAHFPVTVYVCSLTNVFKRRSAAWVQNGWLDLAYITKFGTHGDRDASWYGTVRTICACSVTAIYRHSLDAAITSSWTLPAARGTVVTTYVCGLWCLDAAAATATGGAGDDEDDDASVVFWTVSEMIRRATETSQHQQHVVVEEQPALDKQQQQQQELTNSVTVRVPAASRTGVSRLNSSVNVNVVDLYSASTRSVSRSGRPL